MAGRHVGVLGEGAMTNDNYTYEDPDEIDLSQETCPDCDGDSDPIDDLFYCSTCACRGWIYGEMINAPHLDHWYVEQMARETGQLPPLSEAQKGARQDMRSLMARMLTVPTTGQEGEQVGWN